MTGTREAGTGADLQAGISLVHSRKRDREQCDLSTEKGAYGRDKDGEAGAARLYRTEAGKSEHSGDAGRARKGNPGRFPGGGCLETRFSRR